MRQSVRKIKDDTGGHHADIRLLQVADTIPVARSGLMYHNAARPAAGYLHKTDQSER